MRSGRRGGGRPRGGKRATSLRRSAPDRGHPSELTNAEYGCATRMRQETRTTRPRTRLRLIGAGMGMLTQLRDWLVARVKARAEAEAARASERFALAAPEISDVNFVDELERLLCRADADQPGNCGALGRSGEILVEDLGQLSAETNRRFFWRSPNAFKRRATWAKGRGSRPPGA